MQQNLAAAIVVILLTAAGTWLLEELRQSCLEAAHNCVLLDARRH